MRRVLVVVACCIGGALPSWAEDQAAIPGFTLSEGTYTPDEPWVEGQPRVTGLQQPFPKMVSLDKNPMTPEKVHLGKLLYFDPIVSGDNTISCATCHHPDFGFSDGRKTSMGVDGIGLGPDRKDGHSLPRAAPTIWNAAYNHLQFWDGRAVDLEDQASNPITAAEEMNQDPAELVEELSAIPEYVTLFEGVFGDEDAVNFEHVVTAIAAFERTILSFNSPFDRYSQGDGNALNASEKRGLAQFRSVKTRCFECHRFPTFSDSTFRVLGVPNNGDDVGRAGVPGQGPVAAFRVPTLRNIALTAPYMHNGAFDTLEEVIDFYAEAGGRDLPDPPEGIDDKIGTFPISDQERTDLVAFLNALTDTSLQPEPPTTVPSGLPVLEVKTHAKAPLPPVALAKSRAETKPASNQKKSDQSMADRLDAIAQRSQVAQNPASAVFTVREGQLIQRAIDRALPGDRVEVMPGTYNESVVIDKSGITLVGIVEEGERPVLDGRHSFSDAIQVSGDDFTIEGFRIQHYVGNGVVASKVKNVVFRDLIIDNAGLYGVYPVECTGVLVERCVVSRISDAGIYVGQSRDIVVRDNETFLNVAGIEIENSVNTLVVNNSSHHNTAGLLVFCMPNNPSKEASHCKVINNRFFANNGENFGKEGTTVSSISPGAGIIIMAADHTEVTRNLIQDNGSIGIIVMSLLSAPLPGTRDHELDIEPNSDHTWVHSNVYENNGTAPSEQYKKDFQGAPGVDLFWDGTGEKNQWQESNELTQIPDDLLLKNGGVHSNVIEFI